MTDFDDLPDRHSWLATKLKTSPHHVQSLFALPYGHLTVVVIAALLFAVYSALHGLLIDWWIVLHLETALGASPSKQSDPSWSCDCRPCRLPAKLLLRL